VSDFGRVYHFDNDFRFRLEQNRYGKIVLMQIGELCCEAGYSVGVHRQWCYEISYIASGEGTFYTNGRATHVKANDLYINGCDEDHDIVADEGSQLRYMYLGFNVIDEDAESSGLGEILDFFNNNPNPCMQDTCGVGELLRKTIKEFYCDRPCFKEVVEASLSLIVLLSYRNAVSGAQAMGMKNSSSSNVGVTVYTIIRYVDDHAGEITAIRDLADRLGFSYTYISHLFRNKTGMTLQQYISRKKMEKAEELMTEAGLTVSQTAERLGYQSVQAFSKAFRNLYGESPTAYLRRARGHSPLTGETYLDQGGRQT